MAGLGVDSGEWEGPRAEALRVMVRVRPLRRAAEAAGGPDGAAAGPPETVEAVAANESLRRISVDAGDGLLTADVDDVAGPTSDNGAVFRKIDKLLGSITGNVLAGVNSTVLAYGQTGTGKTHSMHGVGGGRCARAASSARKS